MMSTAAPTRRPQFTDPRPTRRRRQRWAIALGIVVIAATTVWIVWFSSLLEVRDVRVLGAEGARADEVSTVASIPLGVPLARLDTAEAERALRQLPWVAAAEVRRGWPSEVVIAVETREPVAALASDPQRTAIDKDGVVFEAAEVLPKKLPKVTAEGAALPAAMQVLVTLPEDLSKRVVAVTATTLDDIDLSLRSGDTVRWGSADRGDVKAEVLRALLKRKADLYDVSAPELPTTFRLS